MKENDDFRFVDFLKGCAEMYGRAVSESQAMIFFKALADYEFADVQRAFEAHIKNSKVFPTPAHIIENIPRHAFSGHIGADEAWVLALKAMDENATVILNPQILEAREVVMDIYYSGDKVGARMAFRDAYNRIVAGAQNPKWFISLGHNQSDRVDVVTDAYRKGMISNAMALELLPSKDRDEFLLQMHTNGQLPSSSHGLNNLSYD